MPIELTQPCSVLHNGTLRYTTGVLRYRKVPQTMTMTIVPEARERDWEAQLAAANAEAARLRDGLAALVADLDSYAAKRDTEAADLTSRHLHADALAPTAKAETARRFARRAARLLAGE